MAGLVFGSDEAQAALRREKGLPLAVKDWLRYARATARAKKNPADAVAKFEAATVLVRWEQMGLTPDEVYRYWALVKERKGEQLALIK
jgi:hypothetical protein